VIIGVSLAKKPNTQFKNMPKSLPLVLALIVFFMLGVQVGKGNSTRKQLKTSTNSFRVALPALAQS
jgi:hypothetical protein